MTSSAAANEQFGVESETSYTGRHALVPVLIGLTSPILVISLIDPRALASVSVIFHIYLFLIFVVATGAYIYSVIEPGEITKVTFDKKSRKVMVTRSGLFATTAEEVPFYDIAAVRIEARFDDDGYQTDIPVMVMTDHKTMLLPAGTSEGDVIKIRAILHGQ